MTPPTTPSPDGIEEWYRAQSEHAELELVGVWLVGEVPIHQLYYVMEIPAGHNTITHKIQNDKKNQKWSMFNLIQQWL